MNMHWRDSFSGRRHSRNPISIAFVLVLAPLLLAIVFGGATQKNPLQIMAVELSSLPAFLWGLWKLADGAGFRTHRLAIWVLASIVAIPVIQLIPLPPAIWANWPGHGAPANALQEAGIALGWRPISLTPRQTLSDALALIAPIGIFLAALRLSSKECARLAGVVIVGGLFSIAIGAVQITGGDMSPLYFYDPTNLGSAVGFFSNRNHQASFLIACLPFAALWVGLGRKSQNLRIPLVAGALSIFLVMIIGLVIVKSRAGVILLPVALLAGLAIILKSDMHKNRRFAIMVSGAVGGALLLGAIFGIGPVLDRFSDSAVDGRGDTTLSVMRSSVDYLPFGSGIGSFVPVFSSVQPIETMVAAVWNHAHNDYAELWLEAGFGALGAFVLFLAWWVASTISAWKGKADLRTSLAQAGSAVTALFLIHSLADYPLRTLALASVFALACAFMEKSRISEAD